MLTDATSIAVSSGKIPIRRAILLRSPSRSVRVLLATVASCLAGCNPDITFTNGLSENLPFDESAERSVLRCRPGTASYTIDEVCFEADKCPPVVVDLEVPCTETSGIGASLVQVTATLIDESGTVVQEFQRARSLSQSVGGSQSTTISVPLTLTMSQAKAWALAAQPTEFPDSAAGAFRVTVHGISQSGHPLLTYPPAMVPASLVIKKKDGGAQPCTPSCTGRECGADGCGGSCGECWGPSQCSDGICAPPCGDGVCSEAENSTTCCQDCGCPGGEKCQQGKCSCVPQCHDSECGSDGCGGSCGACPSGTTCQWGQCTCEPQCSPGSCGPDGCGGTCGGCVEGSQCLAGTCQPFSAGCIHDCTKMVYIPSGPFTMGCSVTDSGCTEDASPSHDAWIADFLIDTTEVSAEKYAQCVADGGCTVPAKGTKCTFGDATRGTHPVNCVTHDQASQYCAWAGKRLPTEAEWEKAAQSATGSGQYPWGSQVPTCASGHAEFGLCTAATSPAGSFPAGASIWGLLDMAGNVSEWVHDWYGPYAAETQTGPGGPPLGSYRITRGGGWASDASEVTITKRTKRVPETSSVMTGFRCAL